MEKETEFMNRLLPDHYTCEERENGVHCYSDIGISEEGCNVWDTVMEEIREEFGDRFIEVFHQTCTNHVKFTVYLKSK